VFRDSIYHSMFVTCHSEGAERPKNLTQGKFHKKKALRAFATLRMTTKSLLKEGFGSNGLSY